MSEEQQVWPDERGYFGEYGGQVIPVPGGVLLRSSKGDVIGAVGVTGDSSDNDAIAAMAGIEAAKLIGEI